MNDDRPPPSSSQPDDDPDATVPAAASEDSTWLGRATIAVLLCVASVVVVIVGARYQDNMKTAEQERIAQRQQAAESKAADAERAAAEDLYTSCADQLMPLLTELKHTEARLQIGLTNPELTKLIGDASVANSDLKIDSLDPGTCRTAATLLQQAFELYAGTVTTWNDCLDKSGCDDTALDPGFQKKWTRAERTVAKAERLLESLNPDSASYGESVPTQAS